MAPSANPTDQQSDIVIFSSSSSQQFNDDNDGASQTSDCDDRQPPPISPQSAVRYLTNTVSTTVGGKICKRKIARHSSQKTFVTFNKRVSFKYIKHIDDYTDEDYFATWYVEEDLTEIFNDCVDNVRKMVNGIPLSETEGCCSRGLEYKTPTGSKARKENKLRGIHAVLEEQERQRELRIRNPELIAKLYYLAGADSRRACRFLAMQDEQDARTIVQSKSSISLLRKQQQEKREDEEQHGGNKAKVCQSSLEPDFNYSATSVIEELSMPPIEDNDQGSSPALNLGRVRFEPPEEDDWSSGNEDY
jgi:hypothetical protein